MSRKDEHLLELVRKAKARDEQAFGAILKELTPDIKKKIARYYIKGADEEDLLQEARLGLWKAVQDFSESGGMAFRYFAINVCVLRHVQTQIGAADRFKYRLQNEARSLETPVMADDDGTEQTLKDFIQDENSDPLDMIIRREEMEVNCRNLSHRLTPLEREVFDHFKEDDSYRGIADATNQKLKTIDNALMRIRKKAKETYREWERNVEKDDDEFSGLF